MLVKKFGSFFNNGARKVRWMDWQMAVTLSRRTNKKHWGNNPLETAAEMLNTYSQQLQFDPLFMHPEYCATSSNFVASSHTKPSFCLSSFHHRHIARQNLTFSLMWPKMELTTLHTTRKRSRYLMFFLLLCVVFFFITLYILRRKMCHHKTSRVEEEEKQTFLCALMLRPRSRRKGSKKLLFASSGRSKSSYPKTITIFFFFLLFSFRGIKRSRIGYEKSWLCGLIHPTVNLGSAARTLL